MVSHKKVMCPYCHTTHSASAAIGTSGIDKENMKLVLPVNIRQD